MGVEELSQEFEKIKNICNHWKHVFSTTILAALMSTSAYSEEPEINTTSTITKNPVVLICDPKQEHPDQIYVECQPCGNGTNTPTCHPNEPRVWTEY